MTRACVGSWLKTIKDHRGITDRGERMEKRQTSNVPVNGMLSRFAPLMVYSHLGGRLRPAVQSQHERLTCTDLENPMPPKRCGINMDKRGASPDDTRIDDVPVVWTINRPPGGFCIGSWFGRTTAYRQYQEAPRVRASQAKPGTRPSLSPACQEPR